MNQVKIGEFLRELRKGKGLTQEQLAEQFNISRRSVSRWETGSNMPDVGLLIEIADFFEVDIREIIDGERKSENMEKEKETLKKVAEYADAEKAKLKKKVSNIFKWRRTPARCLPPGYSRNTFSPTRCRSPSPPPRATFP